MCVYVSIFRDMQIACSTHICWWLMGNWNPVQDGEWKCDDAWQRLIEKKIQEKNSKRYWSIEFFWFCVRFSMCTRTVLLQPRWIKCSRANSNVSNGKMKQKKEEKLFGLSWKQKRKKFRARIFKFSIGDFEKFERYSTNFKLFPKVFFYMNNFILVKENYFWLRHHCRQTIKCALKHEINFFAY